MSIVAVALACVAVAVAAPPAASPDQAAQVLRSEFNKQPDGAYVYGFEADNGIARQETGELKEVLDEDNKPHAVVVVRGSYSYTDPEGNPVSITYVADETGFHAQGASIPKGPARR